MNPTRRITVAGVKGMILLLALTLASCAPAPATRTSTEMPQASKPQVLVAYGKLPLSFEANQGQTDQQVKFLSRGSGYTLFLTSTEAVLVLRKPVPQKSRQDLKGLRLESFGRPASLGVGENAVVRMKLLGGDP